MHYFLIPLLSSSVGSMFISHDRTEGSGQGKGGDFVGYHWFIFKDGTKGCSLHGDLGLDLSVLFVWHKNEDIEKCLSKTHGYVLQNGLLIPTPPFIWCSPWSSIWSTPKHSPTSSRSSLYWLATHSVTALSTKDSVGELTLSHGISFVTTRLSMNHFEW